MRALLALLLLTGLSCGHRPATPELPSCGGVVGEPQPAPPRVAPPLPEDPTGVAVGTNGAVASAEAHASRAGLAVLKAGGNAVDAAIAVAFALAVTHPSAGNLGGGGFMLIRMAHGTATAIDYRETAPGAASANMYLDAAGNVTRDSVLGARAAGIPGTVAGLAVAHARFGTRPWPELVTPAIELAHDGHVLDSFHAEDLTRAVTAMRAAGFEDSARVYLAEDGSALAAGQRWRQPELARTLRRIAEQGPRAFYEGELAERLVAGVQTAGGLWTADDLRRYRAVERVPLAFDYRGHRVLSMPPPSSGGIVLRQILAASELLHLEQQPWLSVQSLHPYLEAARRAFSDRSELLGDPDFVAVPTHQLTSLEYVRSRMQDIDLSRATPSEQIHGGLPAAPPASPESPDTTHFSVVDGEGNAVSNTYTLNASFGAKLVVFGTGVLLNNEMDDFAAKPGVPNAYGLVQSAHNAIAPHKRMLSSMTPVIVLSNGELRAVVGSPGGPTIINTVAQILRALLEYGRPLHEAVRAPRAHHQWKPDVVTLEQAFGPEVEAGLRELGHQVRRTDDMGHANCIEVDPSLRGFRAVADVARDGGEASAY